MAHDFPTFADIGAVYGPLLPEHGQVPEMMDRMKILQLGVTFWRMLRAVTHEVRP
jgi:hypothetical protein